MAAVAAVLGAVGIGMSAYGMWKSGQDAAAAGAFNANMYNYQAKMIEDKKQLTRREYERRIDQIEGESVVAVASSGYDMKGSYLSVINDTLTQAQLDKQKALYNLDIEKFQAASNAQAATMSGQAAQSAANTEALATTLTEGSKWYASYGGSTKTTKTTGGNTGWGNVGAKGSVSKGISGGGGVSKGISGGARV